MVYKFLYNFSGYKYNILFTRLKKMFQVMFFLLFLIRNDILYLKIKYISFYLKLFIYINLLLL